MDIDGQDYFHSWLLVNPVKLWRYTRGIVESVSGINKDVCGSKLLSMTTSAYAMIIYLNENATLLLVSL